MGMSSALALVGPTTPQMAAGMPMMGAGMPGIGMGGAPGFMPMQQMYPQPHQQMQMQQMQQMGYPPMNPAGFPPQHAMQMGYPPGMQQGFYTGQSAPSSHGKRLGSKYSYFDDLARVQQWVLSKLGRVFHERGKALKVCIPSAGFAAFFAIIGIVLLIDSDSASTSATLQTCKVLLTRNVEVKVGNAVRYRPTVHVAVVGEPLEQVVTRFRDPSQWQVELEEALDYLQHFCIGCHVPCYQFSDGAIQLDDSDYTSIWSYIIMIVLLLMAFICCCLWLASGTFACCSPLVTVTLAMPTAHLKQSAKVAPQAMEASPPGDPPVAGSAMPAPSHQGVPGALQQAAIGETPQAGPNAPQPGDALSPVPEGPESVGMD